MSNLLIQKDHQSSNSCLLIHAYPGMKSIIELPWPIHNQNSFIRRYLARSWPTYLTANQAIDL